MISPDFRGIDNVSMINPIKQFVSFNYGDSMWADMATDIAAVEKTYNSLVSVHQQKQNVPQLEIFQKYFLDNYMNMASFQKYFTFGKLNTQLSMSFSATDSIDKKRVSGDSPILSSISSLYNYAVCMSARACYMDLGGDGIKVAAQLFKKAAWIFNHLITMATQLPPGYHSIDFNKEALTMNREMCLAQAQYLFFKKASDAGMAPNVLAKIAAQTAIYFDNAHKECSVNSSLRGYNRGHTTNVLGYHARYF